MPKTIEELEKQVKDLEKENKELKKPFETSKLSDEDIEKVFSDERIWKHPRFKELNERAKLGDQLKKEKEDAEQKKLEDDKKFQEALELEKKKSAELETQLKQQSIDNSIKTEAVKLGAKNPETVAKLIDRSKISVNSDGSITGLTEAIKSLGESDKYLFDESKVNLGNGTNPNGANNGTPKFKLSEIQKPEFYQEHEKEITEAVKNGQVENDIQ